ncbi:hypothetical protein KAFR_0H02410 [Kazachstania africana CBS 2517]|uniref:Kinesin-like protein n=1 Tax=Kazachstania africana (strain ATCC 22294 / BCRC 22015 / CBS 2517 / CECT 1963 / NBRC 1671 / NRRL Y-8276) TaxID=1071382 RepID=H2AZ94_KAZAF|nr:hypothetical protein KAFR_0H02410 [Kazachstania africana CBS 2517]CCF59650.1 hypothetical protein KAFR_0H02410 [Kazachstania africana CBS 2517]
MIQKTRKTTPMRSVSGGSSGIPPPSPSLRTVSSFSNIRRSSHMRSTSGSSDVSSSSPPPSLPSTGSSLSSSIKTSYIQRNDSVRKISNNESYSGTITVTVRVKPVPHQNKEVWEYSNFKIRNVETINTNNDEYKFDHVFSPHVDNFEIYKTTAIPLIDKLFTGFNATLFCYGMTGSGKTYTMMGDNENPDGIVPLSVSLLFNQVLNSRNDKKYDVILSYLEIYNEKIYDLLDDDRTNHLLTPSRFTSTPSRLNSSELRIRDDLEYGVKITGLNEERCDTSQELMKWIKYGDSNRKTSETEYNLRSSRSHAVILVRLVTHNVIDGSKTSSTLTLCDLAGSERAAGQQERRKEGAFINKSLLALGTVISKLSAESLSNSKHVSNPMGPPASPSLNSNGNNHIPYRDSKLTRLLQPALSGNSAVTTICTIDPRMETYAETINTLRFASRAKNVSLRFNIKKNLSTISKSEVEKDKIIKELTFRLEKQKETINDMKLKSSHDTSNKFSLDNPNISLLQTENSILKKKLENYENIMNKDMIELQDSQMSEIIDMLPIEIGALLENKFQGMESQIRQFQKYTNELENKILNLKKQNRSLLNNSTYSLDKDDEILELQKMLERKDKIIEAFQSVSKLRDRALKPISQSNIASLPQPPPISKSTFL